MLQPKRTKFRKKQKGRVKGIAQRGHSINFGNFTCLPKDHVEKLVQKAYLWNSYSSSIVRAINDRISTPSIRGVRYVLPSKMNYSALVFHSLSIISVFKNAVIIRSIAFFLIYLFLIVF